MLRPHVSEYPVVLDRELDDFAVINDYAEELFAYPVNALPRGRSRAPEPGTILSHHRGIDLASRLGAGRRPRRLQAWRAVGGMLLVNDGPVMDPIRRGDPAGTVLLHRLASSPGSRSRLKRACLMPIALRTARSGSCGGWRLGEAHDSRLGKSGRRVDVPILGDHRPAAKCAVTVFVLSHAFRVGRR